MVEEKGTNIEGQTTVVVWWLERAASLLPESADLWTPMRAPGPTSGADPGSITYGFIAMLCPLLTLASRGIMILTFEVCITDCPKSWSGLLAFAAARVLGITEVAALLAFVAAEEMLFSEESGIVWAAEPQLDFFVSFIDLAMLDVQLPHVHVQAL